MSSNDKVLIMYHGSDFDGKCSGAIAYKYYKDQDYDIELYPIEWETVEKFNLRDCEDKIVVLCDFSLPPETMDRINRVAKQFIWIDHHKSAVNALTEYNKTVDEPLNLKGLRDISETIAACELTWRFFYGTKVPIPINYLSQYDTSWNAFHLKPEIMEFQYGLKSYDTEDVTSDLWGKLISPNEDSSFIQEILRNGRIIISYNNIWNKDYYKKYLQEGTFEYNGEVYSENCAFVNIGLHEAYFLQHLKSDYELVILYCKLATGQYTLGLYSLTIDCSEIAKLFGGGGHAGAGGARVDKLPF